MKFLKTFFFILLCLGFLSCNNSSAKKEVKKTNTSIKKPSFKKEETIQKGWDSINRDNVQPFLIAFGKENTATKVLIKTNFGDIKLKLYQDTPLHRASFLFLTKTGFFNNTVFYRVVKNFVIQGGNSEDLNKTKLRNKYGNYKLYSEFRKHRKHKYGALAATRLWEDNPNKMSIPFEFYIVHSKDGAHHLNNEHTVFGEVISGFSTMDKIANVKVGSDEWPAINITMKVEILN